MLSPIITWGQLYDKGSRDKGDQQRTFPRPLCIPRQCRQSLTFRIAEHHKKGFKSNSLTKKAKETCTDSDSKQD